MEVNFQSLSYTSSRKVILDNVSGRFLPGELTAILGPSGAGKTTLLNAISGYKRKGVKGRIEAGRRRFRCYIGQEDLIAPFLTCAELMGFASRLKLPASLSDKQRAVVVEELQSTLGLDGCSNCRTECLSGGQRKRLSIALELISNPTIVFLDEPTSGLDIVSAGLLLRLLSKLARSGRTIVITIHQPSASLFALFDRVYFLTMGKCVYQGGPAAHLVHFLAKQNFVCPRHYNPADYLIEIIENKENIDILCNASENGRLSWYNKEVDEQKSLSLTEQFTGPFLVQMMAEPTVEEASCSTSFWLQFSVILSRIVIQTKRNTLSLKLQFLHYLLCAAILSLMFFRTGNDSSQFSGHLKLCVSIVIFHSYTQQMGPSVYYPLEVKLLKREHFNQWYSLLPYFMAFKISKAPYMVILVLLYTTIVYVLTELPLELTRYLSFYLVSVVLSFVAEAFGLTIGALFNVTNGSMIGSLAMAPLLGLAIYGYDFMRDVPPLMELLVRFSFMRSGVYALFLVIFGLDRKPMDCPEEIAHCYFKDPNVAIHFLHLEDMPFWRPFGDLVINMIFFWLTFYFALKWRLRS